MQPISTTGDPVILARVLTCAAAAGIPPERLGRLAHSWSNHVVMIEGPVPAVLRICFIGNLDRVVAEVMLARELPAQVHAPRLIDWGRAVTEAGEELTWSVSHRLSGMVLSEAWPTLSPVQRQQAAVETAGCLDRLYQHRPNAAAIEALLAVPQHPDLLGGAILGWPLPRMLTLLADPRSALRPDQQEAIAEWITARPELIPRVDSPTLPVIHADVHLSNIWWDGQQVSGLIDFEWARLAEPVADLGRSNERALSDLALAEGGPFPSFLASIRAELPAWQVDHEQEVMATLGYLVRQALLDDPLPIDAGAPLDHVTAITDRLLAGR